MQDSSKYRAISPAYKYRWKGYSKELQEFYPSATDEPFAWQSNRALCLMLDLTGGRHTRGVSTSVAKARDI